MATITKYKIYCNTEAGWQYVWDTAPPTVCPNNAGHTVNSNSATEICDLYHVKFLADSATTYLIDGYNFFSCAPSTNGVTVQLKDVVANANRLMIFYSTTTGTINVVPNGSDKINGTNATYVFSATPKLSLKLQSNGVDDWVVVPVGDDENVSLLEGDVLNDQYTKSTIFGSDGVYLTQLSTGTSQQFVMSNPSSTTGFDFTHVVVFDDASVQAGAGINASKLANGTVSNTEFQYLDGVTSSIQTQLDARVVGPASSTDNAVVRFDTTTGKLVQNSVVTIDDSGDITGLSYAELNDITEPANAADGQGRLFKKTGNPALWWKADSGGIALDLTRASTLETVEVAQLANIDSNVITTTKWGYLANMNQGVATTNSVTFSGLTLNASSTINMGSNVVSGVSGPVLGTDVANKSYVDSVAQGLSVKQSVIVATTAAGTLATSFANGQTIDGVVIATGNRILIKNQATSSENGIYVVQASGAPVRAADLAAGSSAAGTFTFVEKGTVNADSGWVCNTDPPNDLVGTNDITFVQFSGAGSIIAGNGLSKTGNTLDVNVDTTSIEIVTDTLQLVGKPTTKGDLLTFSTAQTSLPVGTDRQVLVADSTQTTGLKWGQVPLLFWSIADSKSVGTNGGSTVANTWTTRSLTNILIDGGSSVTLSSNQFVCTAGTYIVKINSSFFRCGTVRIRLRNVTGSSDVSYSSNVSSINNATSCNIIASIETQISPSSTTTYSVQYICSTARATDGLGLAAGVAGVNEYYTNVSIIKL
jgi:hypothetical protein